MADFCNFVRVIGVHSTSETKRGETGLGNWAIMISGKIEVVTGHLKMTLAAGHDLQTTVILMPSIPR